MTYMGRTVDAQPGTVRPRRYEIKTQTPKLNERHENKSPIVVIIRNGTMLKEVMPSNANESIFLRLYLETPAVLNNRS
jgi:hypothetical protein